MYYLSNFKNGEYPFPNIDVPKEEKNTEKYALNVGQAIYSRHIKDKGGISYSYSTACGELRSYGRAMQSEDKYKSYLSGKVSNSSDEVVTGTDGSWNKNMSYERKGWMNVLWDIVSPAVKIRNMIHGIFDDADFDIKADAVDADSGAEEENRKWKAWINSRAFMKNAMDTLYGRAGLPQEPIEFIPDNLTELEMYQAAGGFKVAYAMALEKLLQHTGNISDWPDLKRKFIDDVIDLNVVAMKCDYTEDMKKAKWRYVDPADLVMQYSKTEDFNDAEYAGEFREMKISELREKLRLEGYGEDVIKTIAQSYIGAYGNPKGAWDGWNSYASTGSFRYDELKTCVFSYEWIDNEPEKKIKYENKYGKVRYLPYKKGQKLGNREELVTVTQKVLYQGSWVLGTEVVFGHGPVNYQPRPAPNRVELTYKAVKLEGKSLTASLLPIYDNIQIGWLKYQNALNTIFEEGYAVDYRMLQNISDGEKKFSAKEAVKMWKETGVLPYMSTPVGQYYRGGNVVPAHKLPGGMGESLNQAIGRLQIQMQLIESITGLSPIALGMQPDPNAAVGTTERSLQASHNALKPLIRGVFKLKNRIASVSASKIQQLVQYDEESRKQYARVVGEVDVESLVMARKNAVEYGFKLEARPTAQEKLQLLRAAEIALSPGRNGLPGIEYADYTYIVERLYAGANLKELRLYLVSAQKRTKREQFQQQQQLEQQRAQNEGQLEQQRSQKEAMKIEMEAKAKIAVNNNDHQNTISEELLKMNKEYIIELTKMAEAELLKTG